MPDGKARGRRFAAVLGLITVLMALALLSVACAPQSRQADAGFTTGFFWTASEPWTTGSPGPIDSGGDPWFSPNFFDESWSAISLPDVTSIGGNPGYDRFYRGTIFLANPASFDLIRLQSDDGIWMYVNGAFVGSWGNGGCVNNPPTSSCGTNQTVPPIDVPMNAMLRRSAAGSARRRSGSPRRTSRPAATRR